MFAFSHQSWNHAYIQWPLYIIMLLRKVSQEVNALPDKGHLLIYVYGGTAKDGQLECIYGILTPAHAVCLALEPGA